MPLRNAANVARFVNAVQAQAKQYRDDARRYAKALSERLSQYAAPRAQAPRLQTAQAVQTLLDELATAPADTVVATLAQAELSTSAAAMGDGMRKAAQLTSTLDTTPWDVFQSVRQLPDTAAISERLTEALERDELALPLASELKSAQAAALQLLTAAAQQKPAAERSPKPEPVVKPENKDLTTQSRSGLRGKEIGRVFAEITRALDAEKNLVVDIQWRVYRHKEQG